MTGKQTSTYVGAYAEEFYNPLLRNAREAREDGLDHGQGKVCTALLLFWLWQGFWYSYRTVCIHLIGTVNPHITPASGRSPVFVYQNRRLIL